MSAFVSPWSRGLFQRWVGLARLVLRPIPGLENRFILRLTEAQNRRVMHHLRRNPPRQVLLIMPRCVKKSGCPVQVQGGLEQCLDCRECPLGDVARLCRRHDIEALVAFRSHIAFEMARTRRPDVIVATACHDRLIKALRNVPDIPALLAPLAGMEKPCRNAGIDLVWLARQLDELGAMGPAAPAGTSPSPATREAEQS